MKRRKMKRPCIRCGKDFEKTSKGDKLCPSCWLKSKPQCHKNKKRKNDKSN
jgi:NMD protein affecting ribosome stability and mRNA decay